MCKARTLEFGAAANAMGAPEKALDWERTCAWNSSPTHVSHCWSWWPSSCCPAAPAVVLACWRRPPTSGHARAARGRQGADQLARSSLARACRGTAGGHMLQPLCAPWSVLNEVWSRVLWSTHRIGCDLSLAVAQSATMWHRVCYLRDLLACAVWWQRARATQDIHNLIKF